MTMAGSPYTAHISTHETIAGSAVEQVTLDDWAMVEVESRGTVADLWFCVDGEGGPAGNGIPTVGGDDCFHVAALVGASLQVPSRKDGATVVKIISSGLQPYSVTGSRS